MFDRESGSLVLNGAKFTRHADVNETVSRAAQAGFEREKQIVHDQLSSITLNNSEYLLTLTFDQGRLYGFEIQCLSPHLTGWEDISNESENQRSINNASVFGFDLSSAQVFDWGQIRSGRDPRDTLSKIWVNYT